MTARPRGHRPVTVGWVGDRPEWVVELASDREDLTFVDVRDAEVVHVAPGAAYPSPAQGQVVVDAATAGAVAEAMDLDRFAPERTLLKTQGPPLKRFKRFHRLGTPAFLYVGPYVPSGGLDVAIEAAFALREEFPDVRVVCIPDGPVDSKFLDECEMRALGLGHRGIIEWTVDAEELPFWYATASVVTVPVRTLPTTSDAPKLAAAAARPFVGSDLPQIPADPSHAWVTRVPPGDAKALAEACAIRFRDVEASNAAGEAARAWAEETLGREAAFARLVDAWRRLASPGTTSLQVA
jgi:glycosyltransferase involved in cell wall biosynthesis